MTQPLLAIIEGVKNHGRQCIYPNTLGLLGNLVAATSEIRVLRMCNPDSSLADDQELYFNASPTLYSQGFETNITDKA